MDKEITMKRLITSTLVAIAFVSGAAMGNRAPAADIYISGTNFIRGYEIDGTETDHKTRQAGPAASLFRRTSKACMSPRPSSR